MTAIITPLLTHFRSGTYDRTRERAFHLSVLLGEGVCAWVVHATGNGELVAMAWSAGDLALKDNHLPEHPVSVSYVALPEWSTLVPDAALVPGTEAQHLSLVHGNAPKGQIRTEPVRLLGATCIYSRSAQAEKTLLELFANARPLPLRSILVRGVLSRSSSKPSVLLHKGADRTEIAIAYQNHLLLCNSFPVHTSADLLYFTLLSVERTGHSPADIDLFYGGTHLNANDRELLAKYFKHLDGAVLDPFPDSNAEQDPADRWLAALEQFACVS